MKCHLPLYRRNIHYSCFWNTPPRIYYVKVIYIWHLFCLWHLRRTHLVIIHGEYYTEGSIAATHRRGKPQPRKPEQPCLLTLQREVVWCRDFFLQMKHGASLNFHHISWHPDVPRVPFVGCSSPAIPIYFPSPPPAHTYMPTQAIGFQLATSSPVK